MDALCLLQLHVYWDQQHEYLYMGCYDGHGGPAAAQWLKQHMHNTVARCMEVRAAWHMGCGTHW